MHQTAVSIESWIRNTSLQQQHMRVAFLHGMEMGEPTCAEKGA